MLGVLYLAKTTLGWRIMACLCPDVLVSLNRMCAGKRAHARIHRVRRHGKQQNSEVPVVDVVVSCTHVASPLVMPAQLMYSSSSV